MNEWPNTFWVGRMKLCHAVLCKRFLRSEYFYLNMTKVEPRGLYLLPVPFPQLHLFLKHLLCSSITLLKKMLAFSILEAPEEDWHLQWLYTTKYCHDVSIIHGSIYSFSISKMGNPFLLCGGFRKGLFQTFVMVGVSFWVNITKWSLE